MFNVNFSTYKIFSKLISENRSQRFIKYTRIKQKLLKIYLELKFNTNISLE